MALSPEERERLLIRDKVHKDQGNYVAALRPATDAIEIRPILFD